MTEESPAPAPRPRAPRQPRTATASTPRQSVLDRLGDGPNAAGTSVVDFVEDALSANREQVLGLIAEHNARNAAFEARVAEFASRGELETVRGEVERIKAAIIKAAMELGGAVAAHNTADATRSPITLEEARAAVARAAQATEAEAQSLSSFESRLHALEILVQDHERRLNGLGTTPLGITLPTVPPAPAGSPAPAAAPVTRTNRFRRFIQDANPRGWGWLAWVLAVIGLLLGLITAVWLMSLASPVLPAWLNWLALPIFGSLGFFGGGVIGFRMGNRPDSHHDDVTTIEETRVQVQA